MMTVPKTYSDSLERRVEHLTQALIEAARERFPEGTMAEGIQRVKLVNKWKREAHARTKELAPIKEGTK